MMMHIKFGIWGDNPVSHTASFIATEPQINNPNFTVSRCGCTRGPTGYCSLTHAHMIQECMFGNFSYYLTSKMRLSSTPGVNNRDDSIWVQSRMKRTRYPPIPRTHCGPISWTWNQTLSVDLGLQSLLRRHWVRSREWWRFY